MKKLVAGILLIVCCLAISSVSATGTDDEYIQNIIVKYAQYVGNLKKDNASVIFDTIGYPYKKTNENLSFVSCNEGTVSIIFVKQSVGSNPDFLGELSYTGDDFSMMISCPRFEGIPEYTLTLGWNSTVYSNLEEMIHAYNEHYDTDIQLLNEK